MVSYKDGDEWFDVAVEPGRIVFQYEVKLGNAMCKGDVLLPLRGGYSFDLADVEKLTPAERLTHLKSVACAMEFLAGRGRVA